MRLAVVFLLAACSVASAAPMAQVASPGGAQYEWSPALEVDVAWSQELMEDGGWALASQLAADYPFHAETADDFVSSDGRPVVAVEWWGAYWNPGAPPYAGDFIVRFYANDPGARFPVPGALLLEQECVDYTEELLPGQSWWYHYYCELDQPFLGETGCTYWVSIQAVYPWYEGGQWGWGECVADDQCGGEAVLIFDAMGVDEWEPLSASDPYLERGCAFVLYSDQMNPVASSSWSAIKGLFR